jgi:aminopeptidase N
MWLKLLAVIFLVFLSGGICNPLEDVDVSEIKQISTFEKPNGFFQENLTTYRLPNDSLPLKYKLELTTDIDKGNFDFTGRVQIWINVTSETSLITLHYRQINVTSVIFRNTTEAYVAACEFSTVESHEFLQIVLPFAQVVGNQFILDIRYNGEVRNDGGGFYRAYYDENETRVWFATTQFEVTDARHAMPCYDEPGIRAPISLTITHSSNYTAVANTKVSSIQQVPPGYHTTTFEETPSMQTYLLVFLISPYKFVSNNDTRVEQRIYAKPSSIANGEGDFAVEVVKLVLEKCEEHFGVDYPLSKMDHAAITQFNFGAMENMGKVT